MSIRHYIEKTFFKFFFGFHGNYIIPGQFVQVREVRAFHVALVSIDQEVINEKSTSKVQKDINVKIFFLIS